MANNGSVFTMIVRHGTKAGVTGYTLIKPDYTTERVDADALAKAIASGKCKVTNLDVKDGKLVGTNGALDKYTLVSDEDGKVIGTARAVVLNRAEKSVAKDGKSKLLGYTVFTHTGSIAELSVADAVALCNKKLISNGKIRHTEEGDIVSAIGGNYPLREIKIAEAPKGNTTVDIMYFGSTVNVETKYFGAIVSCTSAAEMSKLYDKLVESNSKVIAAVRKVGGNDVRDSLAIQRTGANSLYGVFEVKVFDAIVKSGATVKNSLGKILVCATKYDEDYNADESTVVFDKAFKVIDHTKAENDPSLDTKAKNYAKSLLEKFGTVAIK